MRNQSLAAAIRSALVAAATTSMALSGAAAFAQEDLEEVYVTGSRIKRDDVETAALPVTVIPREVLEESGDTSVADFVRDLPFNSFGSARQSSGSSAQSFSGISLRGLGEGRTLILIDGRRAPVAPNVGSAQDLNSIPLAAVERIEILTDGASAIYGSDAIGGVVNIITRRDFNGVQLMVGKGSPEPKGGDTDEASLIFGASGERGSLLAGLSYNHRDIVFQRDREYSSSDNAVSSFSNNFYNAIAAPGTLYGWRAGSSVRNPTYGSVVPGGCSSRGFRIGTSGGLPFCLYNFSLEGAYEAEVGNTSLFARGNYDVTDNWSAYLNTSFARTESFGRYAPVPSSPWPGGSIFIPVGSPNHPAVRFPDAGYDETVPYFMRHRFAALGNRDTFTDAQNYLMDFGLEGTVGNFDINVGIRRSEAQYYELGRNYVVGGLAQQQISSGAYDIYDPPGNPRSVLDSMIATINRDATFLNQELYALVSTELWDLPGGKVGIAVGGEHRKETYKDIYDTLQSSGQIVGSAGNSAFGGRDVTAFFAEVALPVMDNLEVNLAGRRDRYSDYGSDTSPQISVRWSPLEQLTLRASYGEGFRAPTLDIVAAQPAFSAATVRDPQTCAAFGLSPSCTTQVTTYSIANPNLESEQSTQYSFGVAWQPLDWLRAGVDYWNIELENQVSFISISTIISCLESANPGLCPSGLSILPANVNPPVVANGLGFVRDSLTGAILYGQTGYANLGLTNTDGIDVKLRTQLDLGAFGSLASEALYSRTLEYAGSSGVDISGYPGIPQFRAVLANTWTYGNFSVTWNINHIDGTKSAAWQFDYLDDGYAADLPSWTTHDVQVTWKTPWNGRLVLGAVNVGNKGPVVDPLDPTGQGYDQSLYNGYGRVVYVRLMQDL